MAEAKKMFENKKTLIIYTIILAILLFVLFKDNCNKSEREKVLLKERETALRIAKVARERMEKMELTFSKAIKKLDKKIVDTEANLKDRKNLIVKIKKKNKTLISNEKKWKKFNAELKEKIKNGISLSHQEKDIIIFKQSEEITTLKDQAKKTVKKMKSMFSLQQLNIEVARSVTLTEERLKKHYKGRNKKWGLGFIAGVDVLRSQAAIGFGVYYKIL